jgi:hypothetical protein
MIQAHVNRDTDQELVHLARYLALIAKVRRNSMKIYLATQCCGSYPGSRVKKAPNPGSVSQQRIFSKGFLILIVITKLLEI